MWHFGVTDGSHPSQKMHREVKTGQCPKQHWTSYGEEVKAGQGQDKTFHPCIHQDICPVFTEADLLWPAALAPKDLSPAPPGSSSWVEWEWNGSGMGGVFSQTFASRNTQHCLCWLLNTKATAKLMPVLLNGIYTLIIKRGDSSARHIAAIQGFTWLRRLWNGV